MTPAATTILLFLSMGLLAAAASVLWAALKNIRGDAGGEPVKPEPPVDHEREKKRQISRFLFKLRVNAMDRKPNSRRRIDSDIENN